MKLRKYLWELAKIFRKGNIVRIKPTMRCNLSCPYCSVNKAHGRAPEFIELHYYHWVRIIKGNEPVKMVVISGGEPGLYDCVNLLINWCVGRGYLVQVITNLTNISKFRRIYKSWRVIFLSTYHPVGSIERYLMNYNELSRKFYITVRELRPADDMLPQHIPWAQVKAISDSQDETPMKIYAPDGSVHDSCQALDRAGE